MQSVSGNKHTDMRTLISYILASILLVTKGYGCDCLTPNVKDAYNKSDLVAKVTVLSQAVSMDILKYVNVEGDTNNSDYRYSKTPIRIVTVKVLTFYKGLSRADTLVILTNSDGRGCGANFSSKETYLLYAQTKASIHHSSKYKLRPRPKVYWTHVCSRTGVWTKTEEQDIKRTRHR
jgi:hypothetical protein